MFKKILLSLFFIFGLVIMFILPTNAGQTTIYTDPHWESGNITVFIPKDDPNSGSMMRAFQRWQGRSFGNLKFSFVQKAPAQITVEFTESVSGSDGPIGICEKTIQGPYITSAKIKIATKGNQTYSKNLVFTTMLHEVGHALGLNHNSRKYRSIMHDPITEDQDIMSIDVEKIFHIHGWSWGQRRIESAEK